MAPAMTDMDLGAAASATTAKSATELRVQQDVGLDVPVHDGQDAVVVNVGEPLRHVHQRGRPTKEQFAFLVQDRTSPRLPLGMYSRRLAFLVRAAALELHDAVLVPFLVRAAALELHDAVLVPFPASSPPPRTVWMPIRSPRGCSRFWWTATAWTGWHDGRIDLAGCQKRNLGTGIGYHT
jgi:hypothetical protein